MTITYTRTDDEDSNPDSETEVEDQDPDSPAAQISDLLREAPTLGEFTFGGLAKTLPGVPGLYVQGVGLVPLPLVDPTFAARLAECGHLAPFGRGEQTLTDMAVRHTWEFDRNQVSFTNPAWNRGLNKLIPTIADKLGCPGMPLELHLYKMLMYESGCHFVRHRDTEKEDRMFATVVIQLPSVHQGGELVVYQPDGTAVAHDFGAGAGTSAFHSHFAVHYADAEHELKPVTSGYRLALVYSLCWPRGQDQVDLQVAQECAAEISTHLADLAEQDPVFHYFMDHHYTTASIASLGLKALKGDDRDRVRMLQAANARLPHDQRFSFYLLHGRRFVSYGDEGGWGEGRVWFELDSSTSFSKLYAMDGTDKSDWLKSGVNLGQLINPDKRSENGLWRGYSESSVEEYTGNAGVTKDTQYFKFLLVAVSASTGPWAMAPFAGNKKVLQDILAHHPNMDAGDLNRIMEAMPQFVKGPPPAVRRALYLSKNKVAAELFRLIITHALVDSVPVFFATFSDPYPAMTSAVDDDFHPRNVAKEFALLISAMRARPLWHVLHTYVATAFRQQTDALCLGLELVFAAINAGIAPARWQSFLRSLVSSQPLPFGRLDRLNPLLLKAMSQQPVWQAMATGMATALELLDARLDTGLSIISYAIQNTVPAQVWSTLVPATFANLGVPTTQVMRNWQLQSQLWRVLIQSHQPPVLDSVIEAYLSANKPSHLDMPIKEILANLPAAHPTTVPLLLPLMHARLRWLSARIAHYTPLVPANGATSWRVTNFTFPSNADIERFVRSNAPMFVINGFDGIADARAHLRRLKLDPKNTGGYFTGEATGAGKRARIELNKTAAARDIERRALDKYQGQHGELNQVVQRLEGQSVPR